MVAIAIEGVSGSENPGGSAVQDGELVIDVAEYYGSEEFKSASKIRYIQLKHSTQNADKHWTASGLKTTIVGFSQRYKKLRQKFGRERVSHAVTFHFVTNRPISQAVSEAIEDAARQIAPRSAAELSKLEKFTGLSGGELADFCKLFAAEGDHSGCWEQQNILTQELHNYLPMADVDAPVQLEYLVTQKARPKHQDSPEIRLSDVLRALKTFEEDLFPAPSEIEKIAHPVRRYQASTIFEQVWCSTAPMVIHAAAGVGKTVLSRRLVDECPEGSVAILYDCFGNGSYRSASKSRHRHKTALVQIANELAALGLCYPLIPCPTSDNAAYIKAFTSRLRQAAKLLTAANPNAALCVVIDAADNAQMAAAEAGETNSFAKDLIREEMPDGVRLVFLCRPHRQELISPPAHAIRICLEPFTRDETARNLRNKFPSATIHDVDEFHRLTSQNPRVQALALSRKLDLHQVLRLLGPNPTSVADTIESLLDDAIVKLKDSSASHESESISRICGGLAMLRPMVPIEVLSTVSGVEKDAIRSFVFDIGRPLHISGDFVQFQDEPAETWFRERFRPEKSDVIEFVNQLIPIAAGSAYVGSTLPALMLEAGMLPELIEMTLNSEALPATDEIGRREVELQRLQFAFKAALRTQSHALASKLALKAGNETAGDSRRRALLQANTDLTSKFLGHTQIEEIVSRRDFGAGWIGSHHAYEASLLSFVPELKADATSRLRMADEWIENWSRLSEEERRQEEIAYQDIAELTIACLNIYGPISAARQLRRWSPRSLSFHVGRIVASRMIDHGRQEDLNNLAIAAGNNLFFTCAITVELEKIQRFPPDVVTHRQFRILERGLVDIQQIRAGFAEQLPRLEIITSVTVAALNAGVCSDKQAVKLLEQHLPESPPAATVSEYGGSRQPLLRIYCLHAALAGSPIRLIDVAHSRLADEMEGDKNKHSESQELREFNYVIGKLLPWHELSVRVLLGQTDESDCLEEIRGALERGRKNGHGYYRERSSTDDEVALIWLDIALRNASCLKPAIRELNDWRSKKQHPLFTPTLTSLARQCCSHEAAENAGLKYAVECFEIIQNERMDAESRSDDIALIGRAVLSASVEDAQAFFNKAIDFASRTGDENLSRWDAMLHLAEGAEGIEQPAPKLAYRLARCAELTYDYVARDKHFPWQDTVKAICGICPSSAITILSRWRDREFGWQGRLLPTAVECLLEKEAIDGRDALPLIAMRGEWQYEAMLKGALESAVGSEEKELIGAVLIDYASHSTPQSEVPVDAIDVLLEEHNVNRRLGSIVGHNELSHVAHDSDNEATAQSDHDDIADAVSWSEALDGNWYESSDGLDSAYRSFKATPGSLRVENFFRTAFRSIPAKRAPTFLKWVFASRSVSQFVLRDLLNELPHDLLRRPAVSEALTEGIYAFCGQEFSDIRKYRFGSIFPFALVSSLAEVDKRAIAEIVLDRTGQSSEEIDSERLFSLVGLLIEVIQPQEAADALIFGLDLFEPDLSDSDGDGPWVSELEPPSDIPSAVAGYIGAALAAPQSWLRWEAAHAVLACCRLNRKDVTKRLVEMAASQYGGAFVDSSLVFYKLHCTQWLLIAVSRASIEAPASLVPFAEQLIKWSTEEDHILIRAFASRAALQLIRSGSIPSDEGLIDSLENATTSEYDFVDSSAADRVALRQRRAGPTSDSAGFRFGIDIGPYWYARLGTVFGLSQSEIEDLALHAIHTRIDATSTGRWDEDQRAKRRGPSAYSDYRHSHGSYPRCDDLSFYHAYHAMMFVAGDLLAKTPVHCDPDMEGYDPLASWLRGHDLTRDDGLWLWDRRDLQPVDIESRQEAAPSPGGSIEIADECFEEVLNSELGFVVWGAWTKPTAGKAERVRISSALVASSRAGSLARALATAGDPWSYAIPTAGSDMQIRRDGFDLKGWIKDYGDDGGLDKFDPWAGEVSFPPPHPSRSIAESMGLYSDPDLRTWLDGNGAAVMGSDVWGQFTEDHDHYSKTQNYGSRLWSDRSFLSGLLTKLNRQLIVEVQIERKQPYRPLSASEAREPTEETRILLINEHGDVQRH